MKCNLAIFDSVCFTVLSLCTLGVIVVLLGIGIIVVYNLELTPLDTSIFVWMVVALCAACVVLCSALYLTCCKWKYAKLILAIIYTIFDLVILLAAISVFALRSSLLKQIGRMWTDEGQSSIVLYFEEMFNCCGYNEKPSHDCGNRTMSCYETLNNYLAAYSSGIGGILVGIFIILLVGVIISYIRAFSKPEINTDDMQSTSNQIGEPLNMGRDGALAVWF